MAQDGKFYYLLSGRSGVMEGETFAHMASTEKGLEALGFAPGKITNAVLGVDCAGYYHTIWPSHDGMGFGDMQPMHSGYCYGDIKLGAARRTILNTGSGFDGRLVAIVYKDYEAEFLRMVEQMELEPKKLDERLLEELIQ